MDKIFYLIQSPYTDFINYTIKVLFSLFLEQEEKGEGREGGKGSETERKRERERERGRGRERIISAREV
jgi:hypothetical protein